MTRGEKICNRREELGWTGFDLERCTHISQKLIDQIERDYHEPSPKEYRTLCRALELYDPSIAPLFDSAWDHYVYGNHKSSIDWVLEYKEELKRMPAKDKS